jgi:hypothetical protein
MKFETRNPKLETNSKLEKQEAVIVLIDGGGGAIGNSNFGFRICFELRTSNFELL